MDDKETLDELKIQTGQAIADKKDQEIEALVDGVKDDTVVDEEKLDELDQSLSDEQKQIIMQQFIEDFWRRKRRRSVATKKKVTFKQRKKKRSIQKASRRANR